MPCTSTSSTAEQRPRSLIQWQAEIEKPRCQSELGYAVGNYSFAQVSDLPNAPEFMDVMKQHHAFVNQMTDQGNMAIAGPFPFSDQASCEESPFSGWERSRLPS